MNAVNFEEQKPTCLILDEIDGALGGENQANGLNMVAEFLKKSLKAASK
jgi:DNA repair ATPase RecN